MTFTVVRYRVKQEFYDKNQELIGSVFSRLEQLAPAGVSYQSLSDQESGDFIHIFRAEEGVDFKLPELSEFKAFVADIGARCEISPEAKVFQSVGRYSG